MPSVTLCCSATSTHWFFFDHLRSLVNDVATTVRQRIIRVRRGPRYRSGARLLHLWGWLEYLRTKACLFFTSVTNLFPWLFAPTRRSFGVQMVPFFGRADKIISFFDFSLTKTRFFSIRETRPLRQMGAFFSQRFLLYHRS